jgi:hypothetical protein
MPESYPQHPVKGNTINTNRINQDSITTAKIQSRLPDDPPKSAYAASAALLLIIGFALITAGLFITTALVYLTILGGAIILSANVLAILSLRELS